MALEDIEDSAKEDSGDGIPKVVRLVDDILLAALSTMHCWQLELYVFELDDLWIEPLFVSLSQSYPLDDIPSSS